MTVTHERLTLPPEIAAAWAALPTPTAPDYLDRLECAPIEVVVIARRLVDDCRRRDQIESVLVRRVTPLIRAAVRRHARVPFTELWDAAQETMVLFWEAIQDESFLEVRFNLALKRLAQRAGRKVRRGEQGKFERSAIGLGASDSADPDGRDVLADVADDNDEYSRLEDKELVESGLASLPDEQANAVILHYLGGLQIHSQDPDVRTVASELGCGERKARKLIADGRAALRRSFGQEDGDE